LPLLLVPILAIALVYGTNWLSYRVLKRRILQSRTWDLNICSGYTDGGGVNADIFVHARVPNFVLVDVYRLPFQDGQFEAVLCSHTLEHVEDPEAFYRELKRVGHKVTIVIPPLWDLTAAFNVLEHRWVFLSLRKVHHALPPRIRLPLAEAVQRRLGQKVKA
jgi:hypothetical protein